ncbi:cytochrome B [Thiohalorhabdus denitrificans]|uniref:Cytochrome b n=1 Tax=Thiohalorhabdus denitrificans TaxID=381306 RepID=A0A0P9CCJ0_9GAMM|nr:cytochrome b/b6 [Thiohalorhabdus denitrificans]KPV40603.1 cytochrome B [Thiohalorhabdus denitrificans]SCY49867.1 ubiquinol-cytochrome c reductase cytochrome b subunit [Thiohalorhabdus denitrificans]
MNRVIDWVDARYPLMRNIREHLTEYYAPKNFNFMYYFGSLALLVLVVQILSGIWLTMHYKPDAELAFASVEHIMRDVQFGWLIRYMHSTGASAFFIVIYLHMFRGLMYGSYKQPRELVWLVGMLIFLVLMAEAFMGYVLPWGQMSYWGAQVIVNLFTAVPYVGADLAEWIRGGFSISDPTLNRFFALHVVALPIVLLALVAVHLIALHEVGSNNPDGVDIKKNKDESGKPVDGIPFHPYYTVKDIFGAVVFLFVAAVIIFYLPTAGGYVLEHDNFKEANPLQTPAHIKPVWYFGTFYAILRAVPDKLTGVVLMVLAIAFLFLLPWLDRSKAKSWRFRPIYKQMVILFGISFVVLMWLGGQPATATYTMFARIFTVIYFAFFIALPFVSKWEKPKPVPERVTK